MKGNKRAVAIYICVILLIILSIGFDYLIATSDLPAWFKFALLQK